MAAESHPLSLTQSAASRLVDACIRHQVDHFFVAPGSRCTPLTVALANHPQATVVQHFDERGLGFAALGFGRASGRAAAIVCTSGTAVANLLPAVVESSLAHVPLLLLTADRPPELRDTGANQTIDQMKIFGTYARWFFDFPCPSEIWTDRFLASCLERATSYAATGPVHLNLMFREPFDARDSVASSSIDQQPPIAVEPSFRVELPAGNALVIAGDCRIPEAMAARKLAERLQCPFLANVTCGVPRIQHELMLMRPDAPQPDVVVHVGGRIISKRWLQFLDRKPPRYLIHYWPYADRLDPTHRLPQVVRGDLVKLCEGSRIASTTSLAFRSAWEQKSTALWQKAILLLQEQSQISEPAIVMSVADQTPLDHGLVLGNSMPIRDADLFVQWPSARTAPVTANRGASGIDGQLATAVGFAKGSGRPTTIVLGDLSALHDLNSLSLIAQSEIPIRVVVLNNDGGGIFHFLPVANETKQFEPYFGTPHGWTFQHAATQFGLNYQRPASVDEFTAAYRASLDANQSCLLEVQTDRHANRTLHQLIENEMRESAP